MSNHLKNESSPYLLQHAENPVNWYPWCDEAFLRAAAEDKPVFLSIGYSTCHWCHVMAHESFENAEVAKLLNDEFIPIKVDKEERPDIDSVYMSVCVAFTGNGGWPMTIIMTADKQPFFAGTYFPKSSKNGMLGLLELLQLVSEKWKNEREVLLKSARAIVSALSVDGSSGTDNAMDLSEQAFSAFCNSYDIKYGGFGSAPKFPSPHNLIFLFQYARKNNNTAARSMAEATLLAMYRGGIFDHIGYGFCRYSTDERFLVPHFEKMLYDNALLILAYCICYEDTENILYRQIAEKTARFVLRDMKSECGGFFSAKDADSDGEEGKYYAFTPEEITELLGERVGTEFCSYFGITRYGNFYGKSIPNLLGTTKLTDCFDECLPQVRAYREKRCTLYTDDKVLTAWNSYMIAALCRLYRVTQNAEYLSFAKKAQEFIENKLCDGDRVYASFRGEKHSAYGFLGDYAGYSFALLALYDVTLDNNYLHRANEIVARAIHDFFDEQNGGFFQNGLENELLILRPKDSGDGATPGGNSLMTYCLVRLSFLLSDDNIKHVLKKQIDYMSGEAAKYPAGYSMFLVALSEHNNPPELVTVVRVSDDISELPFFVPSDTIVRVLDEPTDEYSLHNGETAYYVCEKNTCLPPMSKEQFIYRR